MPRTAASRHHLLPVIDAPDADGVPRRTLAIRRGVASPDASRHHVVSAGDTFESLAARYLSTPELWWLIADANPVLADLDLRPGTVVAIPTAWPAAERSRRF